MKARLSLTISIAATMLWSCQFDDVLSTPSNEGVIRVTSSLTKTESASGPSTGSTTNDNFKNDEIIYVWADKTGTKDGYIKAWELTATDTKGNFSGESKAWPYDGSSLNFHALHGNFTEPPAPNNKWSDLTSLKHTVLDDQSYDDNRRKSDLLFAEKTGATHGSNVELSFSHLLAKITVKLDLKNSKGITTDEFENATVWIMGIKPEAIFDSSSPTVSTSGETVTDIKAGTISKLTELPSEAYYAGCAIVPLQTINANQSLIKIILKNNRTFIYKASETTTFQEGQEYTYTLTILGKQITGSLSVSEFSSEGDKPISFKDYFDYLADLKTRAYLGSSGAPHDLSYDYNGQMNTANCYVVTHPGYYKFPLVYGNAIKNGATNDIAYGVKDGTSISSTFVNHLGAQITDPYIYKNLNNINVELEANSAALVWQDAESLISNIGLSSDKHYIQFEITKENIEQGNAVIAVKDENGKIMWSWHIWVTNKNVYETQAVTASYQGTTQTFMFMPFPLGWNDSTTAPTCTFYQWGRKDPFPPSDGSLLTSTTDKTVYKYDTNGNSTTSDCWYKVSSQADIATSILNPSTFYSVSANWCSQSSNELWNVGNIATDVNFNSVTKSVYDPSPAGFRLPETAAFTGFTVNGGNEGTPNGTWSSTTRGNTFTTNSVDTYWQACGFRYNDSGSLSYVGSGGRYWSAGPSNNTNGRLLYFDSSTVYPQYHTYRALGYSVRPVSE